MTIKKLKFTKKTATFTFDISEAWSNDTDQTKKVEMLLLSLLYGTFNPLKKFNSDKRPIELDKLRECIKNYDAIIIDMIKNIDTDLLIKLDKIEEL